LRDFRCCYAHSPSDLLISHEKVQNSDKMITQQLLFPPTTGCSVCFYPKRLKEAENHFQWEVEKKLKIGLLPFFVL
jgi:hypothetical protein